MTGYEYLIVFALYVLGAAFILLGVFLLFGMAVCSIIAGGFIIFLASMITRGIARVKTD